MKVHEYQGKEILRSHGIATPEGIACLDSGQARPAAEKLGGDSWVVKAQIHAGGRGKGGGVKLAASLDEVEKAAGEIFGMNLVTHQTGPGGQKVRRLLVEKGARIANELYVGLVIDRARQQIVLMASAEGGMEIEEVAERSPDKIKKVWADADTPFAEAQLAQVAGDIGLSGESKSQFVDIGQRLHKAFVATDASLCEINPLVVTESGSLLALDAKFNFDANGMYRQQQVAELRDEDEEDPTEREAAKHDLSYISLDGDIGCMVNGAGLAMATMDIIKFHNGSPANFLDVGGGASKEKVQAAFELMLANPGIKAILVNIFGGIMRCDVIAEGVVAAAREIGLKIPLIVRLEGTNVEQGKQILADSGLKITSASGMDEAARKVVAAAAGSQ
ncbi:MAG: ADP-forming succinate--CoA ligase subunit beta [Betaproteobacteria bacterium]|nr:ADP-forming succinate--CoA ligase subunit beta [Betaproteobacteria bacterium]